MRVHYEAMSMKDLTRGIRTDLLSIDIAVPRYENSPFHVNRRYTP